MDLSLDARFSNGAATAAAAAAAAAAAPLAKRQRRDELDTPLKSIAPLVEGLRASFASGCMRPLAARKQQLGRLKSLVADNKDALAAAVQQDLARHPAFTAKILGGCVASCQYAIDNVDAWAAPRPLDSIGERQCELRYAARGAVLVVGTWNFPNPLVIKPLASALAAGCCVLVKLSEVCEHTSALLGRLLEAYLDPRVVRCVRGGVPQATEVLRQKFDTIFYTGNTQVGRVVMRAAAEHLCPCVLELGGKNPVLVGHDANVEVAARKIVDGRLKNAGQFCVAPDYVLADAKVKDALVEAMAKAIVDFFGDDPKQSPSYSRIVNQRHTRRIAALLDDAHAGRVAAGGQYDIGACYVAPTVVVDPSPSSRMMTAEIFGPILPVLAVPDMDAAVAFVNARARPLALYVFSGTAETARGVVDATHSGGSCVNDVIIHMLNEVLPFGGCGESGMGSYHGIFGFKAFSHEKAVMSVAASDDGGVRFPPYASAHQ